MTLNSYLLFIFLIFIVLVVLIAISIKTANRQGSGSIQKRLNRDKDREKEGIEPQKELTERKEQKNNNEKIESKKDECKALKEELARLLNIPLNEICLPNDVDKLKWRVEKVKSRLSSSYTEKMYESSARRELFVFADIPHFTNYLAEEMQRHLHLEFITKVTKLADAYIFSIKVFGTKRSTNLRLAVSSNGKLKLSGFSTISSHFKALENSKPHKSLSESPKVKKPIAQIEKSKLASRGSSLSNRISSFEYANYLTEGSILDLQYCDRKGDITRRTIRITRGVYSENGSKYFSAYCYLREDKRTFLLSKIRSLTLNGTGHEREPTRMQNTSAVSGIAFDSLNSGGAYEVDLQEERDSWHETDHSNHDQYISYQMEEVNLADEAAYSIDSQEEIDGW